MRRGALFLLLSIPSLADGERDNQQDNVRRIPKPGIKLEEPVRTELAAGLAELGKEIELLRHDLEKKPALLELLPDVEIYHKSVRYALEYDEFFKASEVGAAKNQLKRGLERARMLREGKPEWTTASGPLARGYISRIDGSVQPYGIFVPQSFQPSSAHKHRLDAWFHGRGEELSELNFIEGVQRSGGPFTPPDSLVLQLYGRYCCANKLAGEVDLFEALESVKKRYVVDENRLVVRGFSMGGAACWQFAVHYSGKWCAAAPGAGFSETADFLKVFQKETVKPTAYEQALWHMYDCTDYAANLFNCPTVAYSGEIDAQKQAADMMAKALAAEGLELTHIIGPKTAHAYEPKAKEEVARRIDSIVQKGRNPVPRKVRFTTWTLKYNEMLWIQVDGLEKHWERARADGELVGDSSVKATTKNVSALTFQMPSGYCPLSPLRAPKVLLDEQPLDAPPVQTDRSWVAHFRKIDGKWSVVPSIDDGTLRKRHDLQGPIDDAFLDRFVIVRPTGSSPYEAVAAWVEKELQHAIGQWRQQFRGEARVVDDAAVTDQDIQSSHLILWGDPSSNKVLARLQGKLPLAWEGSELRLGKETYPAKTHVPLLVFPNPLNPRRYVVLNSGFTYREYDYLNNARQVPKLPDWAVVDVTTSPNSRWPGKVVAADFFTDEWKMK